MGFWLSGLSVASRCARKSGLASGRAEPAVKALIWVVLT